MLPEFEYAKGLFNEYGLELSEEQYEKLDIYEEFLVEYNEKVNLTAITEPDEILKKHFIDSEMLSLTCLNITVCESEPVSLLKRIRRASPCFSQFVIIQIP